MFDTHLSVLHRFTIPAVWVGPWVVLWGGIRSDKARWRPLEPEVRHGMPPYILHSEATKTEANPNVSKFQAPKLRQHQKANTLWTDTTAVSWRESNPEAIGVFVSMPMPSSILVCWKPNSNCTLEGLWLQKSDKKLTLRGLKYHMAVGKKAWICGW